MTRETVVTVVKKHMIEIVDAAITGETTELLAAAKK